MINDSTTRLERISLAIFVYSPRFVRIGPLLRWPINSAMNVGGLRYNTRYVVVGIIPSPKIPGLEKCVHVLDMCMPTRERDGDKSNNVKMLPPQVIPDGVKPFL